MLNKIIMNMFTIKDEEELYQNLKNLSIIYMYVYRYISQAHKIELKTIKLFFNYFKLILPRCNV